MTPLKRSIARLFGIRLFPSSTIAPMSDAGLVGRCASAFIPNATIGETVGEWSDAPTPRADIRKLIWWGAP